MTVLVTLELDRLPIPLKAGSGREYILNVVQKNVLFPGDIIGLDLDLLNPSTQLESLILEYHQFVVTAVVRW